MQHPEKTIGAAGGARRRSWHRPAAVMMNTLDKRVSNTTRKKVGAKKTQLIMTPIDAVAAPGIIKLMPKELRSGKYQLVDTSAFTTVVVQLAKNISGSNTKISPQNLLIGVVKKIGKRGKDHDSWYKTEVIFSGNPRLLGKAELTEKAASEVEVAQPEDGYRNRVAALKEMLDIEDVQKVMQVTSRQAVLAAEKKKRIFNLLPPGRARGAKYPKWQFEPSIEGEPLKNVLAELGEQDAWSKWLFFTSEADRLNGLTPLEVLRGKADAGKKALPDDQSHFLDLSAKARLAIVLETARGFASIEDF
jgi:hypothetical protein